MKPERYQQIEELYHAALERAPEERTAYLKQACNGDQALCEEVESLLAYDAQAEQFIETPPDDLAAGLLDVNVQKSPIVGHTVGHYRMLSLLGAGGMGEVYLAEDTRLKRRVAIKLLPQDLTNNADRLRRFKQEARATSALNHPNILTLHEIGETDGKHYIVTEYVEGETLRHHVQHSRMRLRDLLDTLVQVASALAAAHQAGIIHRDLKPENLMLRPDGIVKVLDFGLAKLSEKLLPTTDSLATTLSQNGTDPGSIMGTVQYMSPEQARGQQVDARSDIFSFGIMMYEMLAGRLPFVGESSADVLVAILDKEPPPLARFVENLPTELQRIATKCLRKVRNDRYQIAKDLLRDLRNVKEELQLQSKREPSFSTEPSTKVSKTTDLNLAKNSAFHLALPKTRFWVSGRSRLKKTLVISLSAIVVIVFLSIYLYSTFRTPAFHAPSLQNEIDYKGLMVLIPAGEFVMGSDNYEIDEKPAHSVSLPAYYIDKFEVTNKQYREFCDATGRTYPKNPILYPDYFLSKPDFPVMGIQFDEAVEYANFVGKRLPTEEEWEKAASWDPYTQSKHIWPWGNTPTPGRANIGTKQPAAVGHYVNDHSAYNVYDMAGNVFEWVDRFYESYDQKQNRRAERVNGLIFRGGAFNVGLYDAARTTYRNYAPRSFPSGMSLPIGIRCVVSENNPNLKEFLNSQGNK
jgi:serine/threonine protein kinase